MGDHNAEADPEQVSKAFSLYFQLINIVEENAAAQLRRKLEDRPSWMCIYPTRSAGAATP